MAKRVYLETLGCRTNVADSSRLAAALQAAGYELVTAADQADIVIVNSCTVTLGADRDAGKQLRRARRARPGALRVLTGCLPAAWEEHRALADADVAVAGSAPDAVLAAIEKTGVRGLGFGVRGSAFPLEASGHLSRANVKIQEGCDNHCAYCIVPAARGAPRSRPPAEVLAEVEAAVAAGFSEVVLTGTHVARYGVDTPAFGTLADLMARIEALPGDFRGRVSSLEPDEHLFPVLERMARSDFWCRHLHLAVQHGADEILRAMNRPYVFARVAELVREAAQVLPDLSLGTDVIVGFPGETDAHHAQSLARLEALPFTYLHVFSFSPRPGTPAALLAGRPPVETVKTRSAALRQLSRQRRAAFAQGQAGRIRDVLIERRREAGSGRLIGLTDNYLRVYVEGSDGWMGRRVACRLRLDGESRLLGEVVDVP